MPWPLDKLKKLPGELQRRASEVEGTLFHNAQAQIDTITEKAQRKAIHAITFSEIEFLRALYAAFAAGGILEGFFEGSQLMTHYLDNTGTALEISSQIYETSSVVKEEMKRQKHLAKAALRRGNGALEQTSDMLLAEQANKRLFYANNRFWLKSVTTKLDNRRCKTAWSVPDHYDFADFKGTSKNWKVHSSYSEIPFHHHKLKVYDGLSRFLIDLHMAKEFDYNAQWEEEWLY